MSSTEDKAKGFFHDINDSEAGQFIGLAANSIQLIQAAVQLYELFSGGGDTSAVLDKLDELEQELQVDFQQLGQLIIAQIGDVIDNENTIAVAQAQASAVPESSAQRQLPQSLPRASVLGPRTRAAAVRPEQSGRPGRRRRSLRGGSDRRQLAARTNGTGMVPFDDGDEPPIDRERDSRSTPQSSGGGALDAGCRPISDCSVRVGSTRTSARRDRASPYRGRRAA